MICGVPGVRIRGLLVLSEYSADAAYRRSLDMLEDDDFWVDEDLERDMEKDDKE